MIAAAFATGAYALIWKLADDLGQSRQAALMVLGFLALMGWTIFSHHPWVRPRRSTGTTASPSLQNAVTLLSLTAGVLVSYAVLFALILLAAYIFVSSHVLAPALGHAVGWHTYITLTRSATP